MAGFAPHGSVKNTLGSHEQLIVVAGQEDPLSPDELFAVREVVDRAENTNFGSVS